MGASTLVTAEEFEQGARLVQELTARNFPVTTAFWAYAENTELWRLVIATPRLMQTPRSRLYREVQDVLSQLDLDISLSQIRLVRDDDPSVANLRALVEAEEGRDRLTTPFGQRDIAGEPVDKGYAYSAGALEYQRQILNAINRIHVPGIAISVDAPVGRREADVVVDYDDRVVIVDVKTTSRPLGVHQVEHLAAFRYEAMAHFDRPVYLIAVSRSGFTNEAKRMVGNTPWLKLIVWMSPEDDATLSSAFADVFSGEPPLR
jgi:hypothetical protein